MRDRPILFSGVMVRANRAGIKTNTRRDLTKTFAKYPQLVGYEPSGKLLPVNGGTLPHVEFIHSELGLWDPDRNPQGRSAWYVPLKAAVGDRLWVRESWKATGLAAFNKPSETRICGRFAYMADSEQQRRDEMIPWRPSIHMPRWASRLTLVVTGVKVERLQDISREDAIAEGLEWVAPTYGISGIASTWNGDPRESYFALWDHINGAGAAAKNPWVACYTYTVHPQNIDAMSKEAA
ncbi:hypothetical protein ELI24_08715 [Rhizobium ruizarguesonis]|uniref:hypothetical protein n=1 Tax=Rhizobium ruizarguesonis TaxID=2081791 RepID=UPI001030CB56|nr:hypothetical protein [Rhizobium ruizarguesonis]TAV98460.1 hypothetical protein ELI24_08715 [Rhizobium ruizarguesonis]